MTAPKGFTFVPTHTIRGEPVMACPGPDDKHFAYRKADGTKLHNSSYAEAVPYVSEEERVAALPDTVDLPADALYAVYTACCRPEWACAHGYGASPRGDDAQVLQQRGPKGEKVVKLTCVDPGRISTVHTIIVPPVGPMRVWKGSFDGE